MSPELDPERVLRLGRELALAGRTLATAESCTAGALAALLTEAPGASAWYLGGVVCYDDGLKVRLGGVSEQTLVEHGAVSAAVARELAIGIRNRTGASCGIGITGIAGPGGAVPGKPVGTVHLALADAGELLTRHHVFDGDRQAVREATLIAALELLGELAAPGSP